jgi:hypothetical protein
MSLKQTSKRKYVERCDLPAWIYRENYQNTRDRCLCASESNQRLISTVLVSLLLPFLCLHENLVKHANQRALSK